MFGFGFLGLTTHCGCIFHSPVACFSLLVFRGFLITHNDASQSVGLLWTSDQSVAETSTWQYNTHNRQTFMPPVGFEHTISAGERPKTYALDRTATGIGCSQWRERQRKKQGQCLTKGGTHGKISAGNLNRIHIRYISCCRGYGVVVVKDVDQEGLAGK
jgi:hypothetical protein